MWCELRNPGPELAATTRRNSGCDLTAVADGPGNTAVALTTRRGMEREMGGGDKRGQETWKGRGGAL